MLHRQETRLALSRVARRALAELEAHARPAGEFDPSRYFRASEALEFLNVRTPVVRALGRSIARAHRGEWTVLDAQAFADLLIDDPRLEVKGVAIETLACFRRDFTPSLLAHCKRWLATNRAANWATTDSICGAIVSPLLQAHRELVPTVVTWVRHRNLWVRRAAAVSLVRLAATGLELDAAYDVATSLRGDPHDLIHKAAGWLLREAGKTDPGRLERYLRRGGPALPRTTLRYAIERFSPQLRNELLKATRAVASTAAARRGRTATLPRRRAAASPNAPLEIRQMAASARRRIR